MLVVNKSSDLLNWLVRSAILSVTVGLFVTAAWVALDYIRVLRLRRRLPPGPVPLPLLGNYFLMRQAAPWIKWEELSHKYGALMTLWNGSRPVIVCSDAWTISDLFEKRANIYSSRPRMVMMGDMVNGTENNQVCLKYNDRWRQHRKLTHAVVGSQAVRAYRGFQGDETKVLLRDLLMQPEDFVMSIERYSCSIVSIIGWGRRIDKVNDYVAQRALEVMEFVDLVVPGTFMMEVLPWLADLPSWINPIPAAMANGARKLHRYFYELSKEASEFDGETNFAKKLLQEQQANDLSDTEVASLTGNLIGGGVDTTSSTMVSMILAMCCFPEKQQKAQKELDRVVGRDRMPEWPDEASLPYVAALVAETLRWRTVTILGGIPHAPTQDDIYNDYLIPKDTWIVGNVWAIHRNPRDYPDPDDFRPERFFNGLERPHPNKKGHNAFGWGRRQCSGEPLATQGLFLSAARLLWAFNMKPGLDQKGNEVSLDIFAYTKSENMRPEPFKAQFIPRTPEVHKLILSEAEAARARLSIYDGESKLRM